MVTVGALEMRLRFTAQIRPRRFAYLSALAAEAIVPAMAMMSLMKSITLSSMSNITSFESGPARREPGVFDHGN